MSSAQQRHIRRVHRVFTLLFVMCLGLISPAAAQPAPEWQLFDLPQAADLILGDVPGSEQAVSLLPAEDVSTLLLASTPIEHVSADMLDASSWRQTASVELWPGDSLALQTEDGQRYALALLDSGTDDPTLVALRYTVLDEPPSSTPVIQEAILAYYDALDLDTGVLLSDETIASVVLCDGSPVEPTPPPTTVPEPGSAGLLLLGVLGVWLSWRLARRKGRAVWLPLLLLSLVFGVQGIDTSALVAQLRDCLLTIEREGNGSGRVIGEGIDCGDSCSIAPLSGGAGGGLPASGEVYHVKAIAEDGSRFVEWLVNGDPYRGLFHMSGDTVLTAVFEETQPPVAVNDRYSTEEDVALEISAPGILGNDSDADGDALTGELVRLPLHGTVILDADGSFAYTPNLDFSGIDQFLYRVSDGELESAIAAVTIEVLAQSDAPAADDRHAETVINTPVEIILQGHDPDGDELRYRIVDLPANGALSAADNQVTYTPNTDFLGQDSFSYLVNDGTSDSNLATVSITVQDIDLAIGAIDLSQTDFDPETMTLSGTAAVTFSNTGADPIDGGYELQVFVKDLQQNSTVEFGRISINEPLAPGDSLTVDVPVDGVTPFKDAPVYAFVDSGNAIAETNEENNMADGMAECEGTPTFSFDDFSSLEGFTLNGVAGQTLTDDGEVLRLTHAQISRAGSAFSSKKIAASRFSSFFQFRITSPGGAYDREWESGADGIVFVVQSVSSSIGGVGNGIGYSGISNSVGIEFDTWCNSYDPNSNHLGINIHGNVYHNAGYPTWNILPHFDDGNRWYAWVDYDGTSIEVRTNQTGIRPAAPTLSAQLDIEAIVGGPDAYIGFTSGTGSAYSHHDILSWEYREEFDPISPCEDYSASFVRMDASEYPNSATLTARIGNSGVIDAAVPLHVAFYEGDPQNGGALLGATSTQETLSSGAYEDVSLTWDAPSYGLHEIYVVVDDDGSGNGSFRESDELNNIASTTLFIGETPVADAGDDRTVLLGELVTLDGSASTDPAGYTPLSYSWQLVSFPDESTAILDDATSATPSFTADLTGTYRIQLVVENTEGIQSAVDNVSIVVIDSMPPTVSILSPADGTGDPLDGSLTIQADAQDADGAIVKVEFYVQNMMFGGAKTLFGETDSSPYIVPWTIVDPGIHEVTARAYDDSGAWSDSDPIHIIVQNGQPEIISEPSYSAPIGELYSYAVEAIDPNNDTLTYSLESRPDGMTIDSATGLIRWTPTEAQVGQQQYRVIVEDGRGAGAGQTVDCYVPDVGNTPPQIVSDPVFTARVGEEYVYDVDATDADGDTLSFRFMKAPDGMSIDSQSGLISWTPAEDQIGTQFVTVIADDGRNGIGGQFYTLTVRAANLPPAVSISAPANGREVEEGCTLTIRAEATDSDDGIEHVDFFLDDTLVGRGYVPAAEGAVPAEIEWPAAGLGEHTVYAIATDKAGASTTSEAVTFTVIENFGDFLRPEVTLTISSTIVNPGDTITIWVDASDNSGSVAASVTVSGEELALNPDGSASYTVGDEAEILTIEASATDAEGNSGSVSREVRVLVPGDTTDPTAEISSPEILTKIYTPTEISGTAADDNLLRYTLEYSPKDQNAWTTFAEGTESVNDGVLGTLDTTLLLNGLYDIRLSVEDASGNISVAETVYQVAGNMKIGLFTISFNDLTIPVSGIPITVTRTYDSRDKLPGDFGIGWTLSTSNINLEESASPGGEWEQIAEGGGGIMNPFTTYKLNETTPHTVTVTYPGGATDEFRMKVTPRQSFPYKVEYVDVTFEAESGTFSTLEALESGSGLAVVGNVNAPVQLADPESWEEYNPNRYRLTRMDGTVIVLNQNSGIETITEPNGNVLTFSEDGITHSNGKSVQFIRDDEGRITEIIDPMGASVTYDYDSYGDLVKISDQEGYDTRFTYEGNHYLKDIIDPRGVRATRNEYDESGSLIATIDPDGQRIEFDHDLDGRTEVIRDRLGYPTVITYDDRGNVLQETDAEGQTKQYSYDERDNLLVEEDQRGYSWVHSYTAKDLMASKSNPLGYTVSAGYNEKGQVETLSDSGGTLLNNLYDDKGNLTQIEEANGAVSSFSYTEQGQPKGYTDQLSKLMQFGYDSDGNVSAMTDPDGNVISFSYDENGRVLQKSSRRTGPNGAETLKTVNVYDQLGRLTHNTDAEGYSSEVVYNAIGKQQSYTDKRGFTTEYVYDALGNLERTIYPDGSEERYTYDAEGRTLSSTNRQGKTSSYEYDKVGRQTKATNPDNSSTETEYDARGQVLAQTDELGRTTKYAYDEAGRNTLVTNAIGQQTEYAYTLNGSLQSMTDAAGRVTSYSYDANGHRTGTSFADGSSVGSTYDEAGRVTSERDQAGRETQYAYDWRGKLLSVTDALNQVTSFSYDEVGNMLTQTDAEGQTTSFEYDNLGRMTRRILPLGQDATMVYDGEDNLLESTDFNGSTIGFEYDADGRVLNKSYPDGTTVSYTYAPDGSQDTVTDRRGTTTLSYDEMGRLESVEFPSWEGSGVGPFGYEYDLAGNRTSVSSPSGSVSYTYDELNRLETVVDPQTGTTRYTYDTVGNLKTVSYPNGTTAEYSYDLLNRLTLLENRGSDGSIISSYTYTLDAAGNRTKVEEYSGCIVEYSYDSTDKLLEERITNPDGSSSVISYTYDRVGNRLTKTEDGVTTAYTYDANNRLIQEDDIIYHYDDNGNLIEKQSAEEQIVYHYDYENHLTRVETTRYGATIMVEYDYDAEGNRVRKTLDGNVVVNYLVDTNRDYAQVVEERDGDGNLLVRYVYGHDLISQTRDNVTSYYHYDGLGSTRALSSSAGIVTDEYSYDAFGLLLEQTGTTENRYLYRGEQFDEELGFYYLRARYMDPNVGRFVTMDAFAGLSQDPVTLHKYLYANANPMTYSDPSGNFSVVEVQMATSIRGILSGIQTDIGMAIFDQVAEGGHAGLKGLALGGLFTVAGVPLIEGLTTVAGNAMEMAGEAIAELLKNRTSMRESFDRLFQKFSRKVCKWVTHACFTADTLVLTRDGKKPIKNIQIGDEVYSENVETGEKGFKRVEQTFVKETKILIHLLIDDIEIKTTPEHPFWIPQKGWIPAGELSVDDTVKLNSGALLKISSITQDILTQPISVYNFEVEEWHTYFVSQHGVLVHNECWRIGSRSVKNVVGDATAVADGVITKVKPGAQSLVSKTRVETYARAMAEGKPKKFDWDNMFYPDNHLMHPGDPDPLIFHRLPNGELQIANGHHRYIAAQMTGTEIPMNNPHAVKIVDVPASFGYGKDWGDQNWY